MLRFGTLMTSSGEANRKVKNNNNKSAHQQKLNTVSLSTRLVKKKKRVNKQNSSVKN